MAWNMISITSEYVYVETLYTLSQYHKSIYN